MGMTKEDGLRCELAREQGRGPKPLTSEAMRAPLSYDWPGNVRQLAGFLERADLSTADEIGMQELEELPYDANGLRYHETLARVRHTFEKRYLET